MENFKIKSIKAREILDSRGMPTLETEIETKAGVFHASVPSGASIGKCEAREVRDREERYQGMGVRRAIRNINEIISPKLKGKDVTEQKEIDEIMIELDGVEDKSNLGANAILGVSMAACRAGAEIKNFFLWKYIEKILNLKSQISNLGDMPAPCFLMVEGGLHAGGELDVQEFMIIPEFKNFKENLETGVKIYQKLKNILKEKFGGSAINVGYEGGFTPLCKKTRQVLDLIMQAIKETGCQNKIKIGLDCATSETYEAGSRKYSLDGEKFSSKELLEFYQKLIKEYPILSLEDAFSQDDWQAWEKINSKFSAEGGFSSGGKSQISNLLIVGDDLTVTNPKRIKQAKEKQACNAIIIKPNQIGTITETIEAVKLAKEFGWKIIVSHRSGETCDDFIADLAVGVGADFVKFGAPARGERVAKYNRLLKIEEELKAQNS